MRVERNEYRVFLVGKLNDRGVYWIKLAKRMDKWWAVTNTVMTVLFHNIFKITDWLRNHQLLNTDRAATNK
jgi:hypothetical protein